jgi:hypothetical protein
MYKALGTYMRTFARFTNMPTFQVIDCTAVFLAGAKNIQKGIIYSS